ncbi:hypothetical protein JCM3770_005120 [Rhodotorula araucariae]
MAKTTGGKKSVSRPGCTRASSLGANATELHRPRPKSSSSSSSAAKKTKSSSGGKHLSTYQQFVKTKTQELKEEYPDMDGADRRAEVLRLWKIDPSNPKAQEESE